MNPKAGSGKPSTNRDHALARFLTIRSQTENLADPLSPEDQTAQSMTNCSPTKWHRAHTTWFFEEFLLDPQQPDYQRVHPDFQYHFNSYYEAVGPRQPRPQRGLITRPSTEEIRQYRIAVNERVSDILSSQPDELPRQIADIVELGANHEQQHQELLLMDIKHLLSHNSTNPRYADPPEGTDGAATLDASVDVTGNEDVAAEPAYRTATLAATALADLASTEGAAGDAIPTRTQDPSTTELPELSGGSAPTATRQPRSVPRGPTPDRKPADGINHTTEPSSDLAADRHGIQPSTWSSHPGGLVQIGHNGDGFSFDNETPRHQVWLEPFQIADHLVTTGQWLEFMADGGYQRAEFWLSDGWAWVNQTEAQAPLYWREDPAGWHQFTLHGLQPIDPVAPVVHVNYYEADAFARWAGARLPTEAEWEVAATAAAHDPDSVVNPVPNTDATGTNTAQAAIVHTNFAGAETTRPDAASPSGLDASPAQANSNDPYLTPNGPALGRPADADQPFALHPVPSDPERAGIQQLFGSVWQWTSSAYSPYPGFHPAAGAVGEYNGKFMVDQQVLRGGACITPVGHSRPSYRNFFQAASQWPFTGLRLARNA